MATDFFLSSIYIIIYFSYVCFCVGTEKNAKKNFFCMKLNFWGFFECNFIDEISQYLIFTILSLKLICLSCFFRTVFRKKEKKSRGKLDSRFSQWFLCSCENVWTFFVRFCIHFCLGFDYWHSEEFTEFSSFIFC